MSEALQQRRKHPRSLGPFDGWSLGIIDFALQLYDLSEGGCFINSTVSARAGRVFDLRIELPGHGTIDVRAETRFVVPEFGYGVRFLEISDESRGRLIDAIAALERARSR